MSRDVTEIFSSSGKKKKNRDCTINFSYLFFKISSKTLSVNSNSFLSFSETQECKNSMLKAAVFSLSSKTAVLHV